MRSTLHDAAAPAPPEVPPIPSSTIRFASTYPAMYNGAPPRPTCHSIRTARCLYRPAPRSARYALLKRKFTPRCVMRRIRPSAKFNRELRRKNQKPSKASDKILRRKIKSGSHKLAQKPIWRRNFTLSCLKKPLFRYKFVK